MAQKAVKHIKITVGGKAFKLITGSPNVGKSVEDIDVTDFDDVEKQRIAHPQKAPGNVSWVIADDGQGEPPAIGEVAEYTVETTYTNGMEDTVLTKTILGYMGSAEPGSIEVSGERRPVWNCEFRKCGKSAESVTVTTTTTA